MFYFALHDIISAVYQLFYTKEVNILLTINNYCRAKSLDEAYDLLQNKSNIIIGGMLWLKMQNKTVNTAIDICGLGLDKIEVKDEKIYIGSMVTLRELETNKLLNELTYGAFSGWAPASATHPPPTPLSAYCSFFVAYAAKCSNYKNRKRRASI